MPSVFDHELASYLVEIEKLKTDSASSLCSNKKQDAALNVTHVHLGLSNRKNMVLVGLCSLVEVRLTEFALEVEKNKSIKLDGQRGMGLSKVEEYLKKSNAIEFGTLKNWERFKHFCTVRNALIHGYGGIVSVKDVEKLKEAFERLEMADSLAFGRRIRLTNDDLCKAHHCIAGLFGELHTFESRLNKRDS